MCSSTFDRVLVWHTHIYILYIYMYVQQFRLWCSHLSTYVRVLANNTTLNCYRTMQESIHISTLSKNQVYRLQMKLLRLTGHLLISMSQQRAYCVLELKYCMNLFWTKLYVYHLHIALAIIFTNPCKSCKIGWSNWHQSWIDDIMHVYNTGPAMCLSVNSGCMDSQQEIQWSGSD